MSNKPKRSKTNITKISAKSADTKPTDTKTTDARTETKPANAPIAETKTAVITKQNQSKETKKSKKDKTKKSDKNHSAEKSLKEVFILTRPFVAVGHYLRDSWREIRQVRWPNRKLTWKMTFAVLIYCAIFILFIVLLDTFFTFIFNLLLNAK